MTPALPDRRVVQADARLLADWLRLRAALWPDCPADDHRADISRQLTQTGRYAAFLAFDAGNAVALLEIALRNDYVNGARFGSPVAFIEGLYVAPRHRRAGLATMMLAAAKAWALARGCSEMASDTGLDNLAAQAAHRALGFEETERVVFYRMAL
ncbi:aminoglycoside 6'-N-acetyltransferase [Chromobacterium subtsugae]|uniref:aminoglycoside 6'-N-acetyltransferase n=1 Tax=Chromobacterium subtsugae TaxID=251747 RepID=UPI000640D84E|nr:aminoglycoside 6'-N-acetyltransferase [Chromobacterium subtsugae]